jgi:hypothetical protein
MNGVKIMFPIKVLFCEDKPEDTVFTGIKYNILNKIKECSNNYEEKYAKTYKESIEKIKELNLLQHDIISIDSILFDREGEEIIKFLIDENIRCFIIWHSSRIPSSDLLPHILVWENDNMNLEQKYKSWISDGYKITRSYTRYLLLISILCQGFIIVKAKMISIEKSSENVKTALNQMKFDISVDLKIDSKKTINISKASWWLKGMGLKRSDKDLFCKRLDQEKSPLKFASMSRLEKTSFENSLTKLTNFFFGKEKEIQLEEIVDLYLILSKYLN